MESIGDAVLVPDDGEEIAPVRLLTAVEFPCGNGAVDGPPADAEVAVTEPPVSVDERKLVDPIENVEFGKGNGAGVGVVSLDDEGEKGEPVPEVEGVDCPGEPVGTLEFDVGKGAEVNKTLVDDTPVPPVGPAVPPIGSVPAVELDRGNGAVFEGVEN